MNRQTLLSIYERLEAIISKLPGPSTERRDRGIEADQRDLSVAKARQDCAGGQTECRCICPAFRSAGQRSANGGGKTDWRLGHLRVARKRRISHPRCAPTERDQPDLERLSRARFRRKVPICLCFSSMEVNRSIWALECEQTVRLLEMAELRHQSKAGLIGVIDFPSATPQDVVEARRLELQAWLSGPGKLSAHFVKSVAVCSFVRFRVDGSIDPDRDERRNLDVLGEMLTRELPGDAQVEMARLVGAKKVQLEIAQHLVRSLTTVCAAIGVQPIPFADFPILTAIQFAMVSGIMHVSGRELGLKSAAEFFGALGVNIGVGMVFREGARAAAKLLPGWGNAISGGVAAAGTYAVGRSAIGYFIEGISIGEARKLFHRQKLPKTR